MTNQELIDNIQKYYAEARDSEYNHSQITRGRKHSISSKVEDLFAYFLLKQLDKENTELWVDYPMTYKSKTKLTKKNNPSSITIYPDIAIVRNNIVTDVIDIKMDLGWKRDFAPTLNKALEAVNELQSVKVGTYKKVDEFGNKTKTGFPIKFSSKLKWHIVVISDQNISHHQMIKNESTASILCAESTLNLYIFTRNQHPNGGIPEIQHEEIERFINNSK